MRGVPAWALKTAAVGLTVLATFGSAAYVGSHVKNDAAPLRPALHPESGLNLAPGAAVQTTTSHPVTETYSS